MAKLKLKVEYKLECAGVTAYGDTLSDAFIDISGKIAECGAMKRIETFDAVMTVTKKATSSHSGRALLETVKTLYSRIEKISNLSSLAPLAAEEAITMEFYHWGSSIEENQEGYPVFRRV